MQTKRTERGRCGGEFFDFKSEKNKFQFIKTLPPIIIIYGESVVIDAAGRTECVCVRFVRIYEINNNDRKQFKKDQRRTPKSVYL